MLESYKRHRRQKFLEDVFTVFFMIVVAAIPVSAGFALFTGEWRYLLITFFCLWVVKK